MSEPLSPGSSGTADSRPIGRGLRTMLAKALFALDPEDIERRLGACETGLRELSRSLSEVVGELQRELERLRDGNVPALERRADETETVLRAVQNELGEVRDARLPGVEKRLDGVEGHLAEAVAELGEVRDRRIPAAVARQDVLVERLAERHEELGSLVERMLRREPLPAPVDSPGEAAIAGALAAVQPALLRELRGAEEEITHRLERYLPVLKEHPPVLDLGSGRGELLLLLREAGVEAVGVEGDPALAAAARRRGLDVRQENVLSAVRREADQSWGAVAAVHLLEHLQPAVLLQLLAEVRRILRDDGVLIVECPNPHSLRVGAALFWLDPTHTRPLLPETLELFLRASGFTIETIEKLHPFPDAQRFSTNGGEPAEPGDTGRRLARLEERLDTMLNGFRDFSIVARKAHLESNGREKA